ncbi:MAG: TolC family protein [Nitrospinota bacterium]|nr:TolC family protein [Nitrospinota bacterium]MDH5678288.1 TolC family protein [Nitrospinota bacterium]MDH5755039.1 TolC family protein [Nitrospinota bacterium]
MRNRKHISVIIFSFVMVALAPGARADGNWWPSLRAELLEQNQGIAAARKKVEALSHIPESKMALADPVVTAGLMSVPVDTFAMDKADMTQKIVGVRQDVPAGSMRSAQATLARVDVLEAQAMFSKDVATAAMELKMAVNEIVFINRALSILNETDMLLDNFVRTSMAKYSSGKGIQANVIQAQLEKSKLVRKRLKFDEQLELGRVRINRLLNRGEEKAFLAPKEYITPAYPVDTSSLWKMAQSYSPMLLMARARVKKAEASLEAARASTAPMWMFSATYGQRDDKQDMARPDFISVTAGFTIPLYKSRKQEMVIAGASVAVTGQADAARDTAREVQARIASAVTSLEQEARLIDLYQTGLIPQATLALESAMSSYQLDKADFLTLLSNQINLLDMQMELESARMRKANLYAKLDAQIGTDGVEE